MTPLQWKRFIIRSIGWVALIVLALLIATLGAAAWRLYGKAEEARLTHRGAAQALEELKARKMAVESSLSKLGTERGIEEEIRLRYQLAKPGEEQIVLVASQSQSAKNSLPETKNFWEVFVGWFSH
jgi:cell division protein FtsB